MTVIYYFVRDLAPPSVQQLARSTSAFADDHGFALYCTTDPIQFPQVWRLPPVFSLQNTRALLHRCPTTVACDGHVGFTTDKRRCERKPVRESIGGARENLIGVQRKFSIRLFLETIDLGRYSRANQSDVFARTANKKLFDNKPVRFFNVQQSASPFVRRVCRALNIVPTTHVQQIPSTMTVQHKRPSTFELMAFRSFPVAHVWTHLKF